MTTHTEKETISPPEIIKKFAISYQTLNYYTNLGLLRALHKKGNKRFYDKKELSAALKKIQKLKNKGYTLRLIRNVINTPEEKLI
jgi:DNA-binding transcriptional MerR regulator